ncbi:MAG: CvpA family protein [Bacilli bacterium]|nr:CvpA family protein [Bacilli bacterium]
MNIVNVVIILLILSGAVVGFKRGFTKELVSALSFFAIIILAFLFKNQVSILLYENLPFFKFGGLFKGVTVLNIALYEALAFVILASILSIIFNIIKLVTSLFEKILTMTIILGIPSKILGAVLGIIESYVWVFILLYLASLPIFNFDLVNNFKYKNDILSKTPILSSFTDETLNVINEFSVLKEKYEETPDAMEFNKETLDLFLKYNIITVKSVDTLVKKDKLKINNIESILTKYRGGK